MARQPDPFPSLIGRIRRIEDWMRRKDSSSPFFGTGVRPNGNQGLDSDNYVPATSGFSLNGGTGVAEFKDIILYDLPNSMLASPVAPGVIYDSRTNFALTTTLTNIRTTTITVPAGFTQAAVSVVVRVHAFNNGANLDYLYGQANIAGFNGYALPLAVSGNGGSGTNVSPFSAVLSGLTPGGSFTVQIAASTAFTNWAADTQNVAEVSGSILWFR